MILTIPRGIYSRQGSDITSDRPSNAGDPALNGRYPSLELLDCSQTDLSANEQRAGASLWNAMLPSLVLAYSGLQSNGI